MSSHVRFITSVVGTSYSGANAKKILEVNSGRSVKTVQDAITAANYLGVKLWIFREPRGLRTSKSRYKRFCSLLGISRGKKRKAPQPTTWATAAAAPEPSFAPYITYTQWHAAQQAIQQGAQNGPTQPGLTNQVPQSIADFIAFS